MEVFETPPRLCDEEAGEDVRRVRRREAGAPIPATDWSTHTGVPQRLIGRHGCTTIVYRRLIGRHTRAYQK